MQFAYPLHLVGIKGTGMSALACLLHDWGNQVTGSDVETHFFTQVPLAERGIPLLPFQPENVASAGLVVYSAAYGPAHPELAAAVHRGIPIYSYPAFLGLLSENKPTIAIAGTHGKTTTTSMVTAAWVAAGAAPSSIIGDGTGIAGQGETLILESCEYKRHFLHYHPEDAIILNLDFDHPDYYHDLADVQQAFAQFARQVKGNLIAWGDDPRLLAALPKETTITYGLGADNQYRATEVEAGPQGSRFTALVGGQPLLQVELTVPGQHNVLNALAAVALAHKKGLDLAKIAEGLRGFQGAKRRFEVEARGQGYLVDDYAHHPTEIAATIESARQRFPGRPLIACFQPHTYSRTSALFAEFAEALKPADQVYLLDIFGSAREQAAGQTVNSAALAEAVGEHGHYVDRGELTRQVEHWLAQGAVVLLMGAGDINKTKALLAV